MISSEPLVDVCVARKSPLYNRLSPIAFRNVIHSYLLAMIYSGNVGVNIANATVTAHSTITYFQIGIPFPLRARTLLTKNIPPQIKPTILISAKFPRLLTNGEYDWNRHHNAVVTKGISASNQWNMKCTFLFVSKQ